MRQSLAPHPMSDHRACTELSYREGVTLAVVAGVENLPFCQGFCRMQQVLTKASRGVTLPPVELQEY